MKTCFYTVSDLKEFSIKCIDLLLDSIEADIEYDFYVVSNNNASCKYNVIYDNNYLSEYVGYLKYSPLLSQNYSYYIYLDSDILFFNKLSKLIPQNKHMSIVKEGCLISNHDWYYFDTTHNNGDRENIQKSQAINAGSFAYSQDVLTVMSKIYDTYATHRTNNNSNNAKLEQQLYNFMVNKYFDFDIDQCYDITPITELFASDKEPIIGKTLYHFCGFSGEMVSKYNSMRTFYDKYKK